MAPNQRGEVSEVVVAHVRAVLIYRRGPWRSCEAVEFVILEWVYWFNNRRLLEPIGKTSRRRKPRNATTLCSASKNWQRDSNQTASGNPGAVQSASNVDSIKSMTWINNDTERGWRANDQRAIP